MTEASPFSLRGKVALVTGGGGPIGAAIARGLARAGAAVSLGGGRSAENLVAVKRSITDAGGTAWSFPADLSRPGACEEIVERTVTEGGGVDILITAHGVQLRKPALEITAAEWDNILSINLKAVFFTCQVAARAMQRAGHGSIITIASLTSEIGLPHLAAYGASKGGVAQLTKALAVEWAPLGIRVNAIAPGRIRTPMTEDIFSNPEQRESFLRVIPLRRAGIPEDLEGAAIFLASDASSYMTGQVLFLDGGWLASGGAPLR